MNFLEKKYLLLLSQQLERFKELREGLYNFRCPFCGDSQKTKFKTRGYIYSNKNGYGRYKCHNCGDNRSVGALIKEISPSLYQQFKLESFSSFGKKRSIKKAENVEKEKSFSKELLSHFHTLSTSNNEVVEYAKERKIPTKFFSKLYSANSLNDISKYLPQYKEIRFPDFPVLMIPFFTWNNECDYISCRSINKNRKDFRFTTFELVKNGLKIWGIPNIDWKKDIFVFEGPLDAMFAKNSLAFASASNFEAEEWLLKKKRKEEICFCFDNDYTKNIQIKKLVKRKIENGFRVLLYNKEFKWKDLNDAALLGNWTEPQIQQYINKRTFHDLRAKLELGNY